LNTLPGYALDVLKNLDFLDVYDETKKENEHVI